MDRMTPKKETQVEDSPEVEKKVEKTKADVKVETKHKKTFWQIVLPWVIVAVVFFLGGMSLIYFTMYKDAKTELAMVKEGAAQLVAKLSTTENDLNQANNDLAAAQSSLTQTTDALNKSQMLEILYKFQADANKARTFLLDHDPASAYLVLPALSADLTALQGLNVDAKFISGLQGNIDSVTQNYEAQPETAIAALKTLSESLDMFIGTIQ
jgi:cellulose biosynthesis protein BcsQ